MPKNINPNQRITVSLHHSNCDGYCCTVMAVRTYEYRQANFADLPYMQSKLRCGCKIDRMQSAEYDQLTLALRA